MSFAERFALLQSRLDGVRSARDTEIEELRDQQRAIHARAERDLAIAQQQHDEEIAALADELAAEAHAALLPLARAFAADGSRAAALAFAEAWRHHDARYRVELGERSGRGEAMAGLGDRVWVVFADVAIARDPGSLPAIVAQWRYPAFGVFPPSLASDTANRSLLGSDPASITDALADVERSVAQVARSNRTSVADDAEMWIAICSGNRERELSKLRANREAIAAAALAEHVAIHRETREQGEKINDLRQDTLSVIYERVRAARASLLGETPAAQ